MASFPRIVGLPGSGAWAFLARCLLSGRAVPSLPLPSFAGPLVLVCPEASELEDVADAYRALAPLFEARTDEAIALFGEDARARQAGLELLKGGSRLVVATAEALAEPFPSPQAFEGATVRFQVGARLRRSEAEERLVRAGYQRADFVESPGEYAVRGAVLDFFGLEPEAAVRVLFDEESVVSMRRFDPMTQATLDFVGEAKAVPAPQEGGGPAASLADWAGPEALWLVAEEVREALPKTGRALVAGRLLEVSPGDLDFGARPQSPCAGEPAAAWEEMRRRAGEGSRVALFSLNRGEDSRVQELLEGRLRPGECQFLIGPLRRGFWHPGLKLAVFATSEIFGRHYRPSSRWRALSGTPGTGLRWQELRQGDYVVHRDYGIARYLGLTPVASPGHGTLDCLRLGFRGSDSLYVPMTEFGRIQKYSGAEGKRPRLSSLDRRRWEEVKAKVQAGVREMAHQLLRSQAARRALPGHAFPAETPMEREFAEAFPYEETPDQARAIAEVLADMAEPSPMDRLVVGDVGFGKTEVAMRAAFKCAAGYKQAAVLVPTTILADQHYRTFSARFADYPVKIALLTRFQSEGEQKRVLAALKAGSLDVVIGTARLLQRDVALKDLGLVVIDEEHRFGVRDKERLKALKRSVDCLALSATPIPRTLNQAMAGLRGISLIESAPSGRQPIVTKVGPWEEGIVAEAILEELGRGGQAYYVHNRVSSLSDCRDQLRKLLPSARFGLVHGKMRGGEIEEAMWAFFNREFDVLVASTIIESGLDIPAVNTLLVEDAHEFGLAQLYQLRGRIGRERQRAYCYLFYPSRYEGFSELSEEARRRLEALREFGELGAGMKLALRDLEIRGAGDLLGARQHGFMHVVGVEFYSQMLQEEVERLQGRGTRAAEPEVALDIKLPAYIPEEYLPSEMERLTFYKRILRTAPAEAARLRRELEDLCGPAPEVVLNLFSLMRVRAWAQRAGVRSVTQRGGRIEAYFEPGAPVDGKVLSRWLKSYEGRLRFIPSPEGDGLWVDLGEEPPLAWLEGFLSALSSSTRSTGSLEKAKGRGPKMEP